MHTFLTIAAICWFIFTGLHWFAVLYTIWDNSRYPFSSPGRLTIHPVRLLLDISAVAYLGARIFGAF